MATAAIDPQFADVAKKVRDANRSEIHRRTGISLSGVSRILNAKRNASTHTLIVIAAELGVTMDLLYRYLCSLRTRPKGRGGRGGRGAKVAA